ncbi:malto-oligosyltrehalose trehalohydrolase [Cellulomonas cellasea]|uniref:malto-oligosyltrehalose trehalohydrolase n=1 Tax=Cellulomonas cellasea TaxID=43670 RepID=UPI0025A3E881|nr:malto-oligosyltrehalose trehalohydrolase [Cellulomonas cellasea]MDM8085385.1 malto-oligosyltrehalose trehalohydrolase [Cellulomonas cellasea]
MRPRVWAPRAGQVELDLPREGRRVPLRRVGDGWWDADLHLAPGTPHAYAVDGAPPHADPRAERLPDGVHGPAEAFDATDFAWTDAGWLGLDARGAVLYELHVGTFTAQGTLDAAIEHLDDLVALGVDMVELMPLASFNGTHGWGYDGVSLYSVHEPYGGPRALQRFVDAAHARGMGVCLDVVHNHLGPSGNYLDVFGPYLTDAHHTPWGAAVNLDQDGSPEVRRWICDSALRWFRDFHLDALRLDAVHALVDDSPQHLLAQLSLEVADLGAELGRPLSLIAESDLNDPVAIRPVAQGGWGMTAQWADDVHHAIHALVTGERHGYYVDFGSPQTLRKALTQVFVHDGGWSAFRGRPWGRPLPPGTDGHQFVVSASNHDQVGNRALGDRPSARLDPGALAVEAALVLLSPFTPMLFMGEEWGARTPWLFFTDHPEPDLAEAVRSGRRAEFGGHGWEELYGGVVEPPDPQARSTFEASRLDRGELRQEGHARLWDWHRQLIALRRAEPDLSSGDLAATRVRFEDAPAEQTSSGWRGWLVVERGDARVVVNLADDERRVPLRTGRPLDVRAAWSPVRVEPPGVDEESGHVVLPGRSVVVLA